MNNPKLAVTIDGVEQQIELLLLSSSRRLSDECFLQKQMGYERYRDWSNSGEGWGAPDAQYALIRTSLQRAGLTFKEVDADVETVVEAIRGTVKEVLEQIGSDALDPTNGE